MVNIAIATEDILSEETLVKIINTHENLNLIHKLGRQGCGYLIKRMDNFNQLANTCKVLVVIDLDRNESHEEYVGSITRNIKNPHANLIFSVPKIEIESWLLADKQGISEFLKISEAKLEASPETLMDPKSNLINLARKCKNKTAKDGLPPKVGSISRIGLSYNSILTDFVREHWSIERAFHNSDSLRRTLQLLDGINN